MAKAKSDSKPRMIQPDESPIKVERQSTDYNTSAMMVSLDQPVLDPDHELAVQIPEGVGASAIDNVTPIESAFAEARQVEDVFASNEAPAPSSPDNSEKSESHEH